MGRVPLCFVGGMRGGEVARFAQEAACRPGLRVGWQHPALCLLMGLSAGPPGNTRPHLSLCVFHLHFLGGGGRLDGGEQ